MIESYRRYMSVWEDEAKLFEDRYHAGKELAKSLKEYKKDNPIVLALPRGGVVLGYEVAKELSAPLDIIVSRKIGLPSNKEFGIGAISEEDVQMLDEKVIKLLHIPPDILENLIEEEKTELGRRIHLYRNNRPLRDIKNRTVILVDDGLATGVTAKAALLALKKLKPKKIVFAAPVCAHETAEALRALSDEVICLVTPYDMRAIGMWYRHFDQVTDEGVVELLQAIKNYSEARPHHHFHL